MPDISLMPITGMSTEIEDKRLHQQGDARRHYVRDAVNVDINASGEILMRKGVMLVTDTPYRNLWQSPLHGDTFATLGDEWVLINPGQWTHTVLTSIGEGEAFHAVLNNQVVVAAPSGIFAFDGQQARRLTLETPAAPMVGEGSGSLAAGRYGAAVAWLRDGQESGLSEMTQITLPDNGSLEITIPLCLDLSVTGYRLYLTDPDGGELRKEHDYPLSVTTVSITTMPDLGGSAAFRHLSPMPTGSFLHYWRGRLINARANILRFSEPLAYHLHDERHGFIIMPQRITFVQPVSGGIWIGQVDHVAFIQGATPDQMTVMRKASRPPVPGSAIQLSANTAGEMGIAGDGAALWLAGNGYVVGTASGELVELQRGVMDGIAGNAGTSVELERRIVTAVS
jgi:hypothetical protein